MTIRKGEYKECLICKKIFYVKPFRIKIAKFCSTKCQSIFNSGKNNPSKRSDVRKKISLKRKYFKHSKESKIKISLSNLGGNNINKKGYHSVIDHIKPYILERDNFECQICGRQDKLQIHHTNGIKLDNTLSNLIILCISCHRKVNFLSKKINAIMKNKIFENIDAANSILLSHKANYILENIYLVDRGNQ